MVNFILKKVKYYINKIYMKQNQKIAIPTHDGNLWQHFGKAPYVTIVTLEENVVKECIVKKAPPHEHGAMPRFLAAEGCTDVVCGGLGAGAVNMLNQLGIAVHAGAPSLPVEQVLQMYLNNTLEFGDGTCHHDGCGGQHHNK